MLIFFLLNKIFNISPLPLIALKLLILSENKTKLWNKLQVSLHFKDLIYLFKYKKEYLKSFIYFLKVTAISFY